MIDWKVERGRGENLWREFDCKWKENISLHMQETKLLQDAHG